METGKLSDIDHHKELLGRAGHTVPASQHIRELYVPAVHEAQRQALIEALKDQYVFFSFDGT